MAENTANPLGGLMGTLLSNPALLQGALSLLSSGGGAGLPDLSGILGTPTESAATANGGAGANGTFDLSEFLATLTPEEKKKDVPEEAPEKAIEAGGLPTPPPKEPPHRHRSTDTALLMALRPYLNRERRAILDNILRFSQVMGLLNSPGRESRIP